MGMQRCNGESNNGRGRVSRGLARQTPMTWAWFCLIIGVTLVSCSPPAPSATALPSLVPSLPASPTAGVEATLTALSPTTAAMQQQALTPLPTVTELPVTVMPVDPVAGRPVPVPLDITLPQGWTERMNDTLLLQDLSNEQALRGIPFVGYGGPITGGEGRIVLLWGFPSLVPTNALDPASALLGTAPAPDLFADGLRLLRLAVIEPACNIGTDLRRDYRVGGLAAVGTQFAAVDCPQEADTRGWFAGVQSGGLNFIFYVYADPITAMDMGRDELQAILDTVVFRVPEATAQP